MTITAGQAKDILLKSWKEFNDDQAPRLGAALAYYAVLSLAPLLILLIAIGGLVFGKEAAQGQLFSELNNMVGPEGAKAIQAMIEGASKPASGIVASLISFATLVFGASSVAGELKSSVNAIWNRPVDTGGIKEIIKQRSAALGVVLGCGFLLLVSLTVSSAIAAAGKFVAGMLPMPEVVMQVLGLVLSFAVITGVFAVLLKYLPDVDVEWRDVLAGAAFTAFLFTVGEFLIGMYLGKASFGSTYGAAGSLVIVLVWVYYSSQIFFFGAEVTQVYSNDYGSRRLKHQAKQPAAPKPDAAKPVNVPAPHASESAAIAGVGSLLGGALALSRIASLFRRRK
jgi:membrane protein